MPRQHCTIFPTLHKKIPGATMNKKTRLYRTAPHITHLMCSLESRFIGSEKNRYFLKISKWQHKLVRDCKRGKLVSYFVNNAAKTCLYGLKILDNIEIKHVFQSRVFFQLSSNLHTSCLSALNFEFGLCPHRFA